MNPSPVGTAEILKGNNSNHEGSGVGKENLRQVQGDPPARRSAGHLRELEAQTEAGIKKWIVDRKPAELTTIH
jgi:hypothetical protein